MTRNNSQTGAVSIFVVIFAALLLTIITVGFLRLMVVEQQRATNDDLSQSAYDSAQTGVEDAKRALIHYQTTCKTLTPAQCADLRAKMGSDTCNEAVRIDDVAGPEGATGEVPIQQSTTDAALNQAYTCVLLSLDTDDYLGEVAMDKSVLVPLISTDNNSDSPGSFDQVTIEWFSSKDLGDLTSVTVPNTTTQPLVDKGSWVNTRPPILRAGLMQFGKTFTTNDFDATVGGQSNAHTLFLYPTRTGNVATSFAGRDPREALDAVIPAGSADAPLPTKCNPTVGAAGSSYSCKITLDIPKPVNGGNRTAYLRLTAMYNSTHFRLTLSKKTGAGSDPRQFSDVQAAVDSTGRASDVFRRIVSRVDLLDTTFAYPEAAVDLAGNLCKDFAVTNDRYSSPGTCAP